MDRGGESRALFITGTRGVGKTALVEQISNRACNDGWIVINLGPDNTIHALTRRLSGFDEESKTVDPQVSISVLGSGGSLGGVATTTIRRPDRSDLDLMLMQACEQDGKGVMVTVDEIQKVDEDDVSSLCNAFQMASRKGYDVILVVAGLPYAHREVTRYKGRTFLRRAVHEELGLLSHIEVGNAFSSAFHMNPGLSIDDDAMQQLIAASFGHPYLVQLLGYYLLTIANGRERSGTIALETSDVEDAVYLARSAYDARALRPMVSELSNSERAYLRAAAACLDTSRIARVDEVASHLGKKTKGANYARDRLVRGGLLVSPERGRVMFNVPLLADFMLQPDGSQSNIDRLHEWGV